MQVGQCHIASSHPLQGPSQILDLRNSGGPGHRRHGWFAAIRPFFDRAALPSADLSAIAAHGRWAEGSSRRRAHLHRAADGWADSPMGDVTLESPDPTVDQPGPVWLLIPQAVSTLRVLWMRPCPAE